MVANPKQPDIILKERKLAATSIRRQVLSMLLEPGVALSRREIEQGLGEDSDRVTIYRTLKILCEHHIVHKVVMENQETRYKLSEQVKSPEHPHFYCGSCNRLLCLSTDLINKRNMPDGYQVHSTQMIMEGICNQCNEK